MASYELTLIAQKHGVKKVIPLNPNGSAQIQDLTITAVPAVHSSGYQDGDQVIYAGEPLGFILQEFGSATLYHAGDTGLFEDMGAVIGRLYQPQIVLLPIGGVYTMKPAEAAVAAQWLRARTVIPMHFGTFPALTGTPAELKREMQRSGGVAQVRELTPGQEVKIKDLL